MKFQIHSVSNVTNNRLSIHLSQTDLAKIAKAAKNLRDDTYNRQPSYITMTLQGYDIEVRRYHFEITWMNDIYISHMAD